MARRAHRAAGQAAPELAAAVGERLAELAMAEARFEVALAPRDGRRGPRGADAIEIGSPPNPGCRPGRCARSPPAASSRG